MGINVTPAVLAAMFTGYSTLYQSALTTAPVVHPYIAMKTKSNTAAELVGWMDKVPTVRKWVGPRVVANATLRYRNIVNEDFETTLQIPRNVVKDDQFGLYSAMATMQGTNMAKWPDREIAKMILLSTCAGPVGYDDVTFFNNAHPVNLDDSSMGTYTNIVTVAESGGSIAQGYGVARALMRNFKGADGEPMGLMGATLLAGPKWEKQMLELANAEFFPAFVQGNTTAGNVGTTQNVWKGSVNPIVMAELGTTEGEKHAWLICDNVPLKPFLFQEREAPVFTPMFNPSDPNVFWLKQYIMGADSRGAFDVTLPFLAVRIDLVA